VKGPLTPDHSAYIDVEILEAVSECHVVIDTGFAGSLYIPEDMIADWGLQFVTSAPIALADNTELIADVYEATVTWFGVSVRVPVLAGPAGSDPLLGMEILEGCRIELDQVNGEVRVERL
jgi:clan AA aspartic protease